MSMNGIHILFSGVANEAQKRKTEQILRLLAEQPFGDWNEMCLNKKKFEFTPFNRDRLIAQIQKSKQWEFQLRSGVTESFFRGVLNLNIFMDAGNIKMDISLEEVMTNFPPDIFNRVRNFVHSMLPLFPGLYKGYVRISGYDYDAFQDKYHLPPLNSCFLSRVYWMHFLGKAEYEYCGFSRKSLLAAPAFSLQEYPGEIILMESIDQPFFWKDSIATEKVIALHKYLLSVMNQE